MVFIRNHVWLLMFCDNISMLIVKVALDGLSPRTRYAQGVTAKIEVKWDFVRGLGVGKVAVHYTRIS
jgi:hypothetical protein